VTAGGRIVAVALLSQGVMGGLALAVARVFRLSFAWGQPGRDVAIGLAVAAVVAAVNYALLGRRHVAGPLQPVRDVVDEILMPLFSRLRAWQMLVIATCAGIGEELFFRGALQPVVGLVAASLLFGLAHVGARTMLAFGAWASAMGLVMGALANATGGLTAPMVAHGAYDLLALAYLRHTAAVREEERPLRV
jgi:membrane protease YdiL (CAAX protease family)